MKWYSPIFLLAVLLFLRCGSSTDSISPLVSQQIAKAYEEPSTQAIKSVHTALQLAAKTKNDSLKFLAATAAFDILSTGYPDSTERYLNRLKLLAKNPNQQSSYWLRKARLAQQREQHNDAYESYKIAKEKAEETSDSTKIAYSLLSMAEIENVFNDYSGSQETTTEALQYLKPQAHPSYEMQAYNLLGITYSSLQDYAKAIESYKKALQLPDTQLNKNIILNNIAYVHILNHRYGSAINILAELSENELPNQTEYARVLHNLGYACYKLGSQNGIGAMLKAVELRERLGILQDLPSSYVDLSDYYKNRNQSLAKSYSQKALDAAKKSNSVDYQLLALKQLVKLGNGNDSKRFFVTYERIDDSISALRRKARNEFANQKFNFRKSDQQNVQLKVQNLIRERQNLIYKFSLAFGLLLALAFFYVMRKRYLKGKRMEAYATETRISKQIHDELANDVFYTLSFAERENLGTTENKATLMNNLDNIYTRTRDISRANSAIATDDTFREQLKDMINGYQSFKQLILLVGIDEIPWLQLHPTQKIELYRVLQELLTNMRKHSQCERVVLLFKSNGKEISVDYTDDGVGGAPESYLKRNGLTIMENRIKSIKGTITFVSETGAGFKASIRFPQKL